MNSSTVYLRYAAASPDEERDVSSYDEDFDLEDDVDEDIDIRLEDAVLSEFTPLGLSMLEPRGDFMELELDFTVGSRDVLHLVVVRFNDSRRRSSEDWCVEKVLQDVDEAAQLAEELEDGVRPSSCSMETSPESVVVRAEVFSLTVSVR
jgi:hypothetical protein